MTSGKENEERRRPDTGAEPEHTSGTTEGPDAGYPSDPDTPLSPEKDIPERTGSARQDPDNPESSQDENSTDHEAGIDEAGSQH